MGADLTVTRLEDSVHGTYYYFAAGGNTLTKDFAWIERILEDKRFRATLEDRSDSMTMISVQGPHSRALLQPLVTSVHSLQDEAFPFSTCQQIEIVGHKLMCLRLTFVGELGFELHIPEESALAVYQAIREAGDVYAAENNVPVRDAGYRAIDSLSAEKNFRHWHADLCNRDTPLEAGIGFTVLSKLKRTGADAPDFLGREALEAQRAAGLKRKLFALQSTTPVCPCTVQKRFGVTECVLVTSDRQRMAIQSDDRLHTAMLTAPRPRRKLQTNGWSRELGK